MKTILLTASIVAVIGLCLGFTQKKQRKASPPPPPPKGISYKKEVVPILNKFCLPCHTEDNMNPSELYLDAYDDMMKGGKHGVAVIPGKPDSSTFITKIGPKPPFGDPMPHKFKRVFPEDTLAILKLWVAQGAKNN
jgi:hypothetical protein